MRPSVEQLQYFYRLPLGRAVSALIGRRIADVWRPYRHITCAGLGFAVPYFDFMKPHADCANSRTIAMMPGGQGGCCWPSGAPCGTVLVESRNLPLADGCLDRMLLVHALEHAANPDRLLRECWRVLKPGGEILIVVPNRRRSWSALESTPFGTGRPWSVRQLNQALGDHLFDVPYWRTALFMPPLVVPWIGPVMRATEPLITDATRNLGGVLVMMGRKATQGTVGGGGKAVPSLAAAGRG